MFVGFTPKDKAAQNRKSLTAEEPKKNGRRGRRKALIGKRLSRLCVCSRFLLHTSRLNTENPTWHKIKS